MTFIKVSSLYITFTYSKLYSLYQLKSSFYVHPSIETLNIINSYIMMFLKPFENNLKDGQTSKIE
jgi:hypothetical protein